MRAVTYERFGPAQEVLALEDLPTPTPQPGEVLVRLETSGVNPSDAKARAGARPGVTKPPFPKIIPHSDGAGVIEAVGEEVDPDRIGTRVWIWNGQWQRAFGTAASYISLPSAQAVPLPNNISFAEGATLGIPALTAIHAVLGRGDVAGQTVLVFGGAGTVGRLAIQVAKAHGASVISTARGAGIEAARAAGADHVLDYRSDRLATDILDATSGALVDQAIEVEFGENIDMLAQVMAPHGRIAAYGSARNLTPVLPYNPLMFKALTIDLVLVYILTARQRNDAIAALTALLETDALDLRIAAILSLEDCAKAHDMVMSAGREGSVVLTI